MTIKKNYNFLTHPVDIGDQGSFFRRVDSLVVGPHTTLDGEQQHLQVSFLLEPERKQAQSHKSVHLSCTFNAVKALFGILTLLETVMTLLPQPPFEIFLPKLPRSYSIKPSVFSCEQAFYCFAISDVHTRVENTFKSRHTVQLI